MADLGAARVAELDRSDMLGAVAGLPTQLAAGYAVARSGLSGVFGQTGVAAPAPPARPSGLAVCGMGGSAIGADLVLACLPGLAVPVTVVRGYGLPAWVHSDALVVAVSYSGDTEETLSCVQDALKRGCRPVCVASGGALAEVADERGLPLISVPSGGQPRASLGYLSMPLLATLEAAGLCADFSADVGETVALLRAANEALGPQAGEATNAAKQLATRMHAKQTVVYGAGLTVPAARRWKGQVNENAKAPAFWNELPELDHNELMGWTSLPHVAAATLAVFLDDVRGDARLLWRAELTAAKLKERGVSVQRVQTRGASRLARLFSLVQFGDYATCYLALLYGVDPTPVGAIQDFKAKLAGGAGA